jgi:L-lactate dehydrogenase complex protein LldE
MGQVSACHEGERCVSETEGGPRRRVGLFVTCLVDLFRPSVGFAAAKLLADAGCEVVVPLQTCCGQPAYNSGDRTTARRLALQAIDGFAGVDFVVAPSGSCAGMLKVHYPQLFADEPDLLRRAEAFAAKVHELVSFLVEVCGVEAVVARCDATATYHDACSGLRELGIRSQPRKLLASVEGLTLAELPDRDVCCGFGGTFAVKYPDISTSIVADKAAAVEATKAQLLLAGDLGCLLNIAGRLSREGSPVAVRHVAEILAGMTDAAPIGVPEGRAP